MNAQLANKTRPLQGRHHQASLSCLANVLTLTVLAPGGSTPLHRAAYCGHSEAVRLLLRHNADITLQDSDGFTAVHKALQQQQLPVLTLFMQQCEAQVPCELRPQISAMMNASC